MEKIPTPPARLDAEFFRDSFNASPIGIAVENLEGQLLFVNPALCRMLGLSQEEMCGKHCIQFSPPEDTERDWALFQQLRAGSIDHYQLEKRYFRPDGSLMWGRLSISLLNSHPSLLILAMVEDITDKRTAEEAVRASEERLRLAQQAARIGTFERNVRTGVVTSTDLEPVYGLPPGTFDGATSAFFHNLIHPDDRAMVMELVDLALKTGQPTTGEWRIFWPDESIHWIAGRWQVFMDESGEPSRVLGANIDVTERKRTEEALLEVNRALEAQAALLRSREDLLKIFVKNVPAAVAMLDRDMRYLEVSDRWCTDYLRGRAQILGRSHYEIFPDMPERWKEVHRRGLQGETLRAEEDYWDGQDGPHWARWEVRPWNTPEGTVGGILVLAEDITHRKQMEESISSMSRKLIESQEQERARIGRELHDDINQRLAMLAVELEQLKVNPSEVQSCVEELLKQTTELSNDVQALSHELHASKLEYLGIAAGMRSFCKEFGKQQKVEIDFQSRDLPSRVPQEISLCLFRVLQEALHNSAKHSGVRHLEVRLRGTPGQIDLAVSDLGAGFDKDTAKLSPGLGLISMQERLKLVKGTLSIESQPMRGTTIRACVPLSVESDAIRAAG